MKKWLYLTPLIILAAASVGILTKFPPGLISRYFKGLNTPPLSMGVAAPRFELESVKGEKVSLVQFEGKPVLIKFWSVY